MQQLPGIEKVDSKKELSCLKRTIYKGRRKVCISLKVDKNKLIIIAYHYRNEIYVKDTEIELKITE